MRKARFVAALAAAIAFAFAAAAPATARTKRFRPLDFVAGNTAGDYSRSPLAVYANTDTSFYAPLRIPHGATITGIRLYSFGSAAMRYALVTKLRPPAAAATVMAEVARDTANPHTTPDPAVGTVIPAAAAIEPGYIYEVRIRCNAGTGVMAVDVDYTP